MAGPLLIPIMAPEDALLILDLDRRFYIGLSRDRTYWHAIQPFEPGNRQSRLTCSCAGGLAHGYCWRSKQADALEEQLARVDVDAWVNDAPTGAGDLVEAFRG